jgi:hypothetical protein
VHRCDVFSSLITPCSRPGEGVVQPPGKDQNSPVFRLADEILVHIFALIGPSSYHHSGFYDCLESWPPPLPRADCVAFSQVCQRWRQLSLSAPLLWTLPLFQWPKFAMEMIDRSGDAPLTLVWPYLHNKPPDVSSPYQVGDRVRPLALAPSFYHTAKHFGRVVELDIYESPTLITHVLMHSVQPALLMERLSFFVHTTEEAGPLRLSEDDLKQLLPLPSLTHLSLSNCYIPSETAIFAKLAYLCIDSDVNLGSATASHRLPLAQLMLCIQQAPLLNRLILRHAVDFSTAGPAGVPFALERLARLELDDDLRCVTAVLTAIITPVNTKMDLIDRGVSHVQTDREAVEQFLGVVAQHRTRTQGPRFELVSIKNDDNFYGDFKGYVSGPFNEEPASPPPDLEMSLEVERCGFAAYFRLVIGSFRLDHVTVLDVELDIDTLYSGWYELWPQHVPTTEDCEAALRGMPMLRTLHLRRECAGIILCRALSTLARTEKPGVPLACPELMGLTLSSMVFATECFSMKASALIDALTDAVEARSVRGYAVGFLLIKDSNVGTLDSEAIREWTFNTFQSWVRYVDVEAPWTGSMSARSSDTTSLRSDGTADTADLIPASTDHSDMDTDTDSNPELEATDDVPEHGTIVEDDGDDAWVTESESEEEDLERARSPSPHPSIPGEYVEDDEAAWVTESDDTSVDEESPIHTDNDMD